MPRPEIAVCADRMTGDDAIHLKIVVLFFLLFTAAPGPAGADEPGTERSRIRQTIRDYLNESAEPEKIQKSLRLLGDQDQVRVLLTLIARHTSPVSTGANSEKDPGIAATNPAPQVLYDLLSERWPHARKPLRNALQADDDRRRAATVATIRRAYPEAGVPDRADESDVEPLQSTLQTLIARDASPRVRRAAAITLATVWPRTAPHLDTLLKRTDAGWPAVRVRALKKLSNLGLEGWKTAPILIEILRRPERYTIDQMPLNIVGWLIRHVSQVLDGLGPATHRATRPILRRMADPSVEGGNSETYLNHLLYEVMDWKEGSAVPETLLADAIRHCDCSAPIALARNRTVRSLTVANALTVRLKSLKGHFFSRGMLTVRVLGRMSRKHRNLVRYLHSLAVSRRPYTRAWAAGAWGRVTGQKKKAVSLLKRVLETATDREEKDVAKLVAGMLGPAAGDLAETIRPDTADGDAALPLEKMLAYYRIRGHPDRFLAYVADQMRPRDSNSGSPYAEDVITTLGPLADELVPTLREIMRNRSEDARMERYRALRVLGFIGPTEKTGKALPAVRKVLSTDREVSPYNRRIAAETLWHLTRDRDTVVSTLADLLDERRFNFFYTTDALRKLGSTARGAIDELKTFVDDRNPYFRERARATIRAIRTDGSGETSDEPIPFERLYEQLAASSPWKSGRAVWRFVRRGKKARSFLKERYRPDGPPLKTLRNHRRQARIEQVFRLMDRGDVQQSSDQEN